MTAETVTAWCAEVAARLRTHQRNNRYKNVADPEQEAVRFVLRALVEGWCPGTAGVLEEVDRMRAGRVAA